ncbi:unnamed protein product [Rhizophagus irregularis]|nr:unnamed protein product [Rhizophagus irregularis]
MFRIFHSFLDPSISGLWCIIHRILTNFLQIFGHVEISMRLCVKRERLSLMLTFRFLLFFRRPIGRSVIYSSNESCTNFEAPKSQFSKHGLLVTC